MPTRHPAVRVIATGGRCVVAGEPFSPMPTTSARRLGGAWPTWRDAWADERLDISVATAPGRGETFHLRAEASPSGFAVVDEDGGSGGEVGSVVEQFGGGEDE